MMFSNIIAFGLRKISHNHEFLLCVLEQQFRSQTTKIVVLKQQFCSQNSKSEQRKQKFIALLHCIVYAIDNPWYNNYTKD